MKDPIGSILILVGILILLVTLLDIQVQRTDKYKQALIDHQIGYYDQTTGVFTIKDSK